MLLLYAVHFYPRTCTPHVLAWTHASHDNPVSPCMVYILPSVIYNSNFFCHFGPSHAFTPRYTSCSIGRARKE